MERDIKRAKGADELPVATLKEPILSEPTIAQLTQEVQDKNAAIERLLKENEELQQKLKNLSRVPVKKGAQTRYWRREEHERFLEALEKYGQRDVKNISAFVGTRSPTQVRTHAQKYFLKQRREETAQMKSANLLARKRRAAAAAAEDGDKFAMEEDGEELEEDEEDGEDEDDGEFGPSLGASDGLDADGGASSSAGASSSTSTTEPARRKSMRATSAATTIKLKTQDLLSLGSSVSSTSSVSTATTTTTSKRTTSVSALSSSGKTATSSPTAQNNHSSSPGASSGAARKVTTTNSTANNYVSTSAAYSGGNSQQRGAKAQARNAAAAAPAPIPPPAATMSHNAYAMHPYGQMVQNAYGSTAGYAPFRTDIFFNADEAALFYKAVKLYERETDRAKVLMSIREFFLPHRSIEELSTMVDMAFSSSFDPSAAAGYNSHAAFHPMYAAQNRMYYGDPNSAHALTTFAVAGQRSSQTPQPQGAPGQPGGQQGGGGGSSSGGQPGEMPVVKIDQLGNYMTQPGGFAAASAAGSFDRMVHHDGQQMDGDFGNAASHVDSSSLASISDRLSEHMGMTNHSSSNAMDQQQQQQQQQQTQQAQQQQPQQQAQQQGQHQPSSGPSSASSSSATNNKGANGTKAKEDDDDSLMSELISLTDRKNASSSSGGLSSFLGGRPLTLSPGVFGSSGTTPLGFSTGMTPLMPGGTPLGFMSPLPIQFTNQPPVNPYFGGPK